MKLSMEILKEYLNMPEKITFFRNADSRFSFSRPVFFIGQSVLKSEVLYIAYAEELKSIDIIEENTALICIGKTPAKYSKEIANILEFSPDTNLLSLSNKMNSIFYQFDQWEQNIISAADNTKLKICFNEY